MGTCQKPNCGKHPQKGFGHNIPPTNCGKKSQKPLIFSTASQNKKPLEGAFRTVKLVAGVGFEPTAFGL